MVKHATEIPINDTARDGDHDAIVYRVRDTGSSLAPVLDRYKHVIFHGLGREPIGCMVILSDKICNVKVVNKNENQIIVQFTAEHADVNVRIW
jgi:hypothetical protein